MTTGTRAFESQKPKLADNRPVAGQQFEYGFDDIGNRTQTKAGGDTNGTNLRESRYTNNALNQITGRGVPGYVEVLGAALATNAVTVNGQTAERQGEYFRKELAVDQAAAAVWQAVTVSSGGTSESGHRFVARAAEAFGYDADGNLTSDGRWTYTWDAENRLVRLMRPPELFSRVIQPRARIARNSCPDLSVNNAPAPSMIPGEKLAAPGAQRRSALARGQTEARKNSLLHHFLSS